MEYLIVILLLFVLLVLGCVLYTLDKIAQTVNRIDSRTGLMAPSLIRVEASLDYQRVKLPPEVEHVISELREEFLRQEMGR